MPWIFYAYKAPSFVSIACLLFYKKYFINIFSLWSDYCKKMNFQSKTIFFQPIAGRFWFCWFVYMCFLGYIFTCSTIMKLRIASYVRICTASYLVSHQIIWHKKIHGYNLKITSCCCFSFSEKLSSRLVLPP